jgi:hypothetical protein
MTRNGKLPSAGGEHNQLTVIEVLVRKGNEASVSRSVMPFQTPSWLEGLAGKIQDRFFLKHINIDFIGIVTVFPGSVPLEEGGRGKLLGISNHHTLLRAADDAKSSFG